MLLYIQGVSLRELLQEYRGSGGKQKRKRGNKVEPSINASGVNIEEEEAELIVKESELNVKEVELETNMISVVSSLSSAYQNTPSTSGRKSTVNQKPIHQTRQKNTYR